MKLTTNERHALAGAINAHISYTNGEGRDLRSLTGGIPHIDYLALMLALAKRVEAGEETAKDDAALRYVVCLDYTRPIVDREGATDDDHVSLAYLLAAFYKVNGHSLRFETATQTHAQTEVVRLLS